eukprot:12883927-Prorocentrum_lima.AAC.1
MWLDQRTSHLLRCHTAWPQQGQHRVGYWQECGLVTDKLHMVLDETGGITFQQWALDAVKQCPLAWEAFHQQ